MIFLLLIFFLANPVSSDDGYNFLINGVTYYPNPIEKNSGVIFKVDARIEQAPEHFEGVGVIGYFDDEPIKAWGTNILVWWVTENVTCYFPVDWPDDTEKHTVKFEIDFLNRYAETNEKDNTFELTLSAKEDIKDIPDISPINSILLKIFNFFRTFLNLIIS